jgi:hypothetical protein
MGRFRHALIRLSLPDFDVDTSLAVFPRWEMVRYYGTDVQGANSIRYPPVIQGLPAARRALRLPKSKTIVPE